MTLWEFRQWVESLVPAWVPFAIAGVGLLGIGMMRFAAWMDAGDDIDAGEE